MKQFIKKYFYLALGGIFFVIGSIGIILPLLPTTVFMILATSCFAKSSPRFHQALLNNRFFGADLRRWEKNRTMLRSAKKRATIVISLMFSISIILLIGKWEIQIMLAILAMVLLFFLWRVAEQKENIT